MQFTKERPTETGRYLFKGVMHHLDADCPCYIPDPIEVEIEPLRAAYQEFMAVGEQLQLPPPKIKQFIRSVDGKYWGSTERWDGEWAALIKPPKTLNPNTQ